MLSNFHGFPLLTGQGALKGVSSQASSIFLPSLGVVCIPPMDIMFKLLIDLQLWASSIESQVPKQTPRNLLAKMETPTPISQATSPLISDLFSLCWVSLTLLPISSPKLQYLSVPRSQTSIPFDRRCSTREYLSTQPKSQAPWRRCFPFFWATKECIKAWKCCVDEGTHGSRCPGISVIDVQLEPLSHYCLRN